MTRRTTNFCILAALTLGIGLTPLRAADKQNIDELRGLTLKNAKVPIFNKGRLQMMIFADSAERRGEDMVGINTVLGIIRRGANADDIDDGWGLAPYPLDSDLPAVLDFWKSRISYYDGVITTRECSIDQIGHRAGGQHDVHFRSPVLDLDGVGFEADFDRRTITVNSQVRIVIRQKSADPAKLLAEGGAKLPAKYDRITAVGDSMLIDSKRNEVMLIGNVRVDEERAYLTCDRLTVFWGGDGKTGEAAGDDSVDSLGAGSSGVDKILADGDVVITRKDNPKEQVFADHLTCDVPAATVKLSGDDKFPRVVGSNGEVVSGKILFFERNTRRGLVTGGCVFESPDGEAKDGRPAAVRRLTSESAFFDGINNYNDFAGGVKLVNGDQVITCDKMRILTADKDQPGGGSKPAAKTDDASLFDTDALASSGGSKEIKKALLYDKVVLSDGANGVLRCEEMHADFARGERGKLDLSHARCFRKVQVENRGDAASGGKPGVITSDNMTLDYQSGKASFLGGVKGRRGDATLDCKQLDLYLVPKSGSSGDGDATGTPAIGAGSGKTLERAVAIGDVHTVDASGTLDCDQLTLIFREAAPGEKTASNGMLHSGTLRLTYIIAEGHVVAVNTASAKAEGKKGFFSGKSSGNRVLRADNGKVDIERNVSTFKDNVSVNDDESKLTCDELFIYGAKVQDEPQIAGVRPPVDPDEDPFALPGYTEDNVPSTINITDDVKLKRVLATGDVRLTRTELDSGKKQEAGGDRGEYLAGERTITLTDTPPRKPWIRGEGRQQFSDRITLDLKDMSFHSHGADTFTYQPAAGGAVK